MVGVSSEVLKVKEKTKLLQEVRIKELNQVNLFGSVQVSTQAVQALLRAEVPLVYFSFGGWFHGMTQPVGLKNIMWRREQFRCADRPAFCLHLARQLVIGKLRNQRTLLMRNHIEPPKDAIQFLKSIQLDAQRADSLATLLGVEGIGARVYFQHFSGMVKSDAQAHRSDEGQSWLDFDFDGRNRRPPRDPVNALLSLGYSLLSKDLTIAAAACGLDPFLGFYHQPRHGRPALALDLMEPFRPLIVDSAVLSAINQRMLEPSDFVCAGDAVALTPSGRKAFFRAYEQRMDQLVTHPLFGYRVSYRRLLEIQTRLLARVFLGELREYPVFVTR
jgi:CRISPR-associated protein Cas1